MKYEYKVVITKVKKAEGIMNQYAKEGWRVVATSPNQAFGFGLVITFEREVK